MSRWPGDEPDWEEREPDLAQLLYWQQEHEELVLGFAVGQPGTMSSEALTADVVAEQPEFWQKVAAIEGLGTRSGWQVLQHKLQQKGHPALADQPPPLVRWIYVEGEQHADGGYEYGEITLEVDALLVTVALREFPEPEHLDWLYRRRNVVEKLVTHELDEQRQLVDALQVRLHCLTWSDGEQSTYLESSDQIAAAMKLLSAEALDRLWIEVPWWRTDNIVGAAVLREVQEAADRHVDVRVVMRPADQRSTYNPEMQRDVIDRLRSAGASVALTTTTHRKTFLADDTVMLSSSNITKSDEWMGNSGVLQFGNDASRRAIDHYQRQWRELRLTEQMLRGE